MKKPNNLLLMFLSLIFLCSCSQVSDRPDAKNTARNGIKEYCESTLVKDGAAFKLGKIESCIIQGNEAVIKINVMVTEKGKDKKKIATAYCESDKDKNWKVTSVNVQ